MTSAADAVDDVPKPAMASSSEAVMQVSGRRYIQILHQDGWPYAAKHGKSTYRIKALNFDANELKIRTLIRCCRNLGQPAKAYDDRVHRRSLFPDGHRMRLDQAS